jgi:hypothetical protein
MRLAVDPAVLAWALHPQGTAARSLLLQHDGFVDTCAMARLRASRHALRHQTGLAPGELWDLLEALLTRVQAVEAEAWAEFGSLAARLVEAPLAPTMAIALALDVDGLLAGGPGFENQGLVPVANAWPRPRQSRLP